MEVKDLIGSSFFFAATLSGALACTLSLRARDLGFFLMVALTVVTFKLDVNFQSHYWYRGTTRGFEVSLVDVLAFSVLAGALLRPRQSALRFYWPAGLGLMLVFFGYACANVFFSEPKIFGVFELSKMARGLIFFLAAAAFVRGERELAILVFALCCALCFEGAWALKQRLHDGLYRVPGTIDDPNSFSMYLCTVAPILAAAANSGLPGWLRRGSAAAVGAAAVSVVLTLSRAGIPIFACVVLGTTVLCVSWRFTLKQVAVAGLVGLCVAGFLFKQWRFIEARWSNDSLSREYQNQDVPDSRGYYLRLARAITQDRFFGVGLNNWSYWVSKKYSALVPPFQADEDYDDLTYSPSQQLLPSFHYAAPAHNLAALTVGELGVPGLLVFALLWLRWFQMGASFLWSRMPGTPRALGVGLFFGIAGTFLQSLTEWVFRQTHIFLTFHVMIGTLASLYWMKRQWNRPAALAGIAEEADWMEYEPAGV